jgi:hypothetical protein
MLSDLADRFGSAELCGIDDQTVTVPRLVLAVEYLLPSGQYESGDVRGTGFDAPTVFIAI